MTNKQQNAAIEIKDLVIDYGESIAVDKINLKINKGELVTLLGPSGCGKSTTLNALAGLITTTSGKIYFDGKNVTKLSPGERNIGLVFQSYALYPHMTVYKNIAFPLEVSKRFKQEVQDKNYALYTEILKLKYESTGAKNFDELFSKYIHYKKGIKELEDELELVYFKHKNVLKNTKELKPQVKVRKDSRTKHISKEVLFVIQDIDERIIELKDEARKIRKSDVDEKKKEKLIEDIRKVFSKIEKTKSNKLKEYKQKIAKINSDFKKELVVASKEKRRITKEVNKWKTEEDKRIKIEINNFTNEFKSPAAEALNEIKTVANSVKPDKKLKEEIVSIKEKTVSLKYEIDKRVREVAEKVGISDQLPKKVTNLSGGQQQRVAISRTLVKNPDVLLLDEPLSNLDAKMRVQTREWIRSLQQELGITTVFVTHDQEEAMSISDRIVCMSNGEIQQFDEPMEMYHNPANKFIAGFLGMPQMNFFDDSTEIGKELSKKIKKKAVTFGIRPEHVKVYKEIPKGKASPYKFKGEVTLVESFGRERLITIEVNGEKVKLFTDDMTIELGNTIECGFKKTKLYMFSDKTKYGDVVGRV